MTHDVGLGLGRSQKMLRG